MAPSCTAHPSGDLTRHELYRTALDGGPALELTGTLSRLDGFAFTPDLLRWAVFRSDFDGAGLELFATRLPRLPRRAGPP
jgi:hypothetical protein